MTNPSARRCLLIDGDILAYKVALSGEHAANWADEGMPELAIEYDRNVARTAILAARSAAWHSSMPGGSAIVAANARVDSEVLIAAIFQAGVIFDGNWAPDEGRSAFLLPVQYALLAQNTKLTNQWNGSGAGYNGVYAEGTQGRPQDALRCGHDAAATGARRGRTAGWHVRVARNIN